MSTQCRFEYRSGDVCHKECAPQINCDYTEYCIQHVILEPWWPTCTVCCNSKVAWYTIGGSLCHFCITRGVEDPSKPLQLAPTRITDSDFPPMSSSGRMRSPVLTPKREKIPRSITPKREKKIVHSAPELITIKSVSPLNKWAVPPRIAPVSPPRMAPFVVQHLQMVQHSMNRLGLTEHTATLLALDHAWIVTGDSIACNIVWRHMNGFF